MEEEEKELDGSMNIENNMDIETIQELRKKTMLFFYYFID